MTQRRRGGCLNVAGEVAARMGQLLEWNDAQLQSALETFEAEVRRTLHCRGGAPST